MEIIIKNFKAITLNFPKRKLRNREEKNWDSSKSQRIVLEKQSACLDGQKGGLIAKFKILPYQKEKIIKNEIQINGFFDYQDKDEEIEELLDTDLNIRLDGKDIEDMDSLEFLLTGRLVPKNSLE